MKYKIGCENCGRLVYERELDENMKCRYCEEKE